MVRRLALTCMLVAGMCSGAHAHHSLVLSGGGARGLSHAGALVALEELGYRPALVVGTSMGAIIGALYAAGHSTAQIRDIIAAENWLERFSPEPLVIGPRREPRRALLGFGISRGRFYGGFIPEAGINQRLIELLFDAGVRARNDFDALPIPYRAVAADLSTGEQVVLAAGDLPRAVRASMAVPGVFAPVRWHDRVLIDGGIANNLPVSVAREIRDGAVIGIDVIRPAPDVKERGAIEVGVRALRLLIENARPEQSSVPDVLVLPEIERRLSETYFPSDASGLIRAGEAAVRQQAPPVAQQPDTRRAPGTPPVAITALRVDNADVATERLVRRIMGGAVREYDAADVVRRVSALHMTGLFQSVWPRVERDDGSATLVVDITRVASTSLSGGARWDNDLGAGAWLLLRQHVELRTPVELRLSGTFDELRTAGSGDVSFFSALVPGLTWNVGGHAIEQRVRIFAGDSLVERPWSRRAGGWLGAELHGSIGEWFISLLGRADHVRDPAHDGWSFGPYLRLTRTPPPDRVVGVDPLVEAEVRAGDIPYERAAVRIGPHIALGRLRIGPVAMFETAGSGTPLHALPATSQLSAPWLEDGRVRAQHIATLGADVAWPILLSGYARLRTRAVGASSEVEALATSARWRLGAELGAVWPTVLGHVAIGYAAGDNGERRLNLRLGSAF